MLVTGDHSATTVAFVELDGCRVDAARFTGADLGRVTLKDCVFVDCDLSGAIVEEMRATRVEFIRCRMSGLLAATARFTDVAFVDCKLDDANLRMTVWERSELSSCDLHEADLYAAKLGGAPITGCDLRGAELSKADLSGCRLQGSRLEGLKGGDSLRGVTLGSDQLVPAAEALFAALDIAIDDEDTP